MKLLDQPKKNLYKFNCYLRGSLGCLIPDKAWQYRRERIFSAFERSDAAEQQAIMQRVNYYNKLESTFRLPEVLSYKHQWYRGKKSTSYSLDFKGLLRYFSQDMRYSYLFGDIVDVPEIPTFLKSRPIATDQSNENSVLLKLNKIRHYYVVKDNLSFEKKIPRLVWRGKSNRAERVRLLEKYFNNDAVASQNVGQGEN